MKAIVLTLAVAFCFANSAHAELSGTQRFTALFTLKNTISNAATRTAQLQLTVEANARYYQNLHFYQLGEKNRTGRQNCADIQSVNMANAMMIAAIMESTGDSLKQIPEINNETTLTELSKITDYLHEAKAANDTCSVPTQSLPHVRRSSALISEVNAYLETIKNELSK